MQVRRTCIFTLVSKNVFSLGDVVYDVTGFLDKNKDTLQKDLLVLVEGSKHPLINTLFPASDGEVKTSKKTISGT